MGMRAPLACDKSGDLWAGTRRSGGCRGRGDNAKRKMKDHVCLLLLPLLPLPLPLRVRRLVGLAVS